jgi:hypothetical protein
MINKWIISIPIKAEHITVYKVVLVSDGGEYTKNSSKSGINSSIVVQIAV